MTEINGYIDSQSLDEKVLLPYLYLQKLPGKNKRTKFTSAFNYWLRIPDDDLRDIGDIVQTTHIATLLMDDIQDNSVLRRGHPVAQNVYGIPLTINAAAHGLLIAVEKALKVKHPKTVPVLIEGLIELHRGQGLELYWRDVDFKCPTEEEYYNIVIRKTGATFMLVIRLMQLFSENKTDFTNVAQKLSLYFQIRDDYCNLFSQEYTVNKSYCDDITEGKFGFPIIHAVRSNKKAGEKILEILSKRTQDIQLKKQCISLLEEVGSFDYTRQTMERLDKEVQDEIEKLGGNPVLESMLNEMRDWRLGEQAKDLDTAFI